MKKIKVMACVSLIFSSWLFKNVDTHSMPNKKVTAASSQATVTTSKTSMSSSSILTSLTESVSSLSISSTSISEPRRNHIPATAIRAGNIIYKPTFDNGVEVREGGRRPHVVIDVESQKNSNWILLTIADISRLNGKEHKMVLGGNNYLLDPTKPPFDGDDMAFVKLNKTIQLRVRAESWQNVSTIKFVSNLDLQLMRGILGFEN